MRIVSGKYGGRVLKSPSDQSIRPTSDKIRGAIFNALLSRINLDDARVIDLFSGSGALGLEALSRGATHCHFVDKSNGSLRLAKDNAQALGVLDDAASFANMDAAQLPRAKDTPATLAFLDPPYDRGLVGPALLSLHQGGWLTQEAWCVAESEADFNPDPMMEYLRPHFFIEDERTYGATKIMYLSYRKEI
ncbi:MAG: 16S rRNA (guanine(966)-N(2))-methyltransferase RsmD [Alphaproteobacteria bacterium]|nr:16S rRNA (guanine(966)-N(2))-methyltransferase RsmD [Alphaproteobacteria bacterium]|tara:strand:- start:1514 stop:2086 length:573 start_codon:yes stop_codon:yes gene_type:complete